MKDRRFSLRCPGAANRRRQHKAAFIKENYVGASLTCFRNDAGKFPLLPTLDGRMVAFACLAAWFLRRPVQSLPQKPPHMVVMKGYAEVTLNQFNHTAGRPQFICPTVGTGSLKEQPFQLSLLSRGQAWCRAKMRLGSQTVRLFRQAQPAVKGTLGDPVDSGNILDKVALENSLNGLTSPSFQFRGGSIRSTHTRLDAQAAKKSHWPRSCR